ncbi:hypothetical protein BGX31_001059 [Mortierella sp. GBA43]|nr:hypothetical protein BGX31_001059 [Mortierella sp. GBA43]
MPTSPASPTSLKSSSKPATEPTTPAPPTTVPEAPADSTESVPPHALSSASTSANVHPAASPKPTEPYTRHNAPKRSNVKPRWHTQPYMMFLALRSMPNHTAARQELINAAVALDRKFSAEKGLPRVFTGKTPMNSASACLTNNGDKYFVPFKPEGSRSTHFRLAYAPGDFETAVKEYDKWMEKLVKHDWPLCFGVPKEGAVPIHLLEQHEQARRALEQEALGTSSDPSTLVTDTTSDSLTTTSTTSSSVTSGTLAPEQNAALSNGDHPSESKKRSPDPTDNGSGSDIRSVKKVKAELDSADLSEVDIGQPSLIQDQGQDHARDRERDCDGDHESKVTDKMKQLELKSGRSATSSPSSTPAVLTLHEPESTGSTLTVATSSSKLMTGSLVKVPGSHPEVQRVDEYRLQDLDLSNVPANISEVVRVDASTIPDSGNGLFAKIDIPASTPLGFYFGVPMTEYEFDSLKDGVGLASHYSIMYRRTVLDATDENGMPYNDPDGRLYCPFHFMNEAPNGNITFITGSVVNQVICQTNKDIKAGEELFVFYGKEVDRFWEKDVPSHDTDKDQTKKSTGSSSRATSPARREEPLTDRPRRNNVHKPSRYTR